MRRAFILLLDSLGIGALPDAVKFGDVGANTLIHIQEHCAAGLADRDGLRHGPLHIPNLTKLGIFAAAAAQQTFAASGLYGSAHEISYGKDTSSGHWEISGSPVLFDWGYFSEFEASFPADLLAKLVDATEIPGILGNCHASGTEIIRRLGDEHCRTGQPICYTSADSVFQIAAHEESFGLERLYQLCQTAFELVQPYRICRVIARPFRGSQGEYWRTDHRRDFSVTPPGETLLDRLVAAGLSVVAIGKIADIFAQRGISERVEAHGNDEIFAAVMAAAQRVQEDALIFANFVDFDMLYGHRRDVIGYAHALEKFDRQLPQFMEKLQPEDLVVITGDHGCDPTFRGTDHTREQIPILCFGPKVTPGYLGVRATFADIGQSLASYLGIVPLNYGESFWGKGTLKKK